MHTLVSISVVAIGAIAVYVAIMGTGYRSFDRLWRASARASAASYKRAGQHHLTIIKVRRGQASPAPPESIHSGWGHREPNVQRMVVLKSLIPSSSSRQSRSASPHPYLTTYFLEPTAPGKQSYRLRKADSAEDGTLFPKVLHDDGLVFTKVPTAESDKIPDSDNTAWARARRSPVWSLAWESQKPTLAQVWMFLYTYFTHQLEVEQFRLRLEGSALQEA
ncbi:hypothetical protein NM208_g14946 [Fusarium decemcellulare]|uniref:Uncharacterized protein n=1 Tax=Fusarium decemcellulare TaxID=57161 RepID=A0ACC1RH30_9HYPO|nr:hypothetical protein NM208_g14946 [Fusarium decemcellulare]